MISVIVPAYNAANTVANCIHALQNQSLQSCLREIIVVDNGSTDRTAAVAAAAGARVVSQPKQGAAAARNAGIHAATGDIVCFTDADCVPTPNWVEAISEPLRQNPEISGSKGVYLTQQKELVARFVQIEYEDKYDLLRPQPTINFIDTYSAAYRRDVLLANNCFDERFTFLEDQELSFRLAARGYKMVFQPAAVVYHLHSHNLYRYFRKKFIIGYWKAQVVSRFPTTGVKDSHTPQVMKVQMGLITLAGAAMLASFFTPFALYPLLLLLLAFFTTTLPFTLKAWRKDKAVALASPAMLAVRALALSLGYIAGTASPRSGISGAESTIGGINYVGKRALDIVGSLIGLLFTLVVGPFIALAIKLESPGPAIFSQERIGQGGAPFTIYKFRSMRASAEAELDRLIDLEELDEPAFKIKNDPRITRIGRFLRRTSLDELPQFWNVLKGEMSLIGPRPEESRVVARYNDWHRRRLTIKPGMSGPMQVNGRGDLPLNQRIQLELEYIENYSLWRDVVLILKTIPSIITGNGAH